MESCVSETVVWHVFQNNLITDKHWPTVTEILLNYCPYTSQKSGDQAINVNKVISLAFVDFRNAFDRRVHFTLFYFISWILGSGEKSRTQRPRNDSCCLIFCWFGLPKKYGAKIIFEKKKKFSPTSTAFKQRYFGLPLLNFAPTPMVWKRVSPKILFST